MAEINTQMTNAGQAPGFDLALAESRRDVQSALDEVLVGPPIEAARFAERLESLVEQQRPKLSRDLPEFLRDYDRWVLVAQYYGLPFFSDEKVLELIHAHMLDIISSGMDIREQLRVFLARHISFEDRNELRQRFIAALESSAEQLGGTPPGLTGERIRVGTLGAWLAYRNSVLGQVPETSIVRETAFIAQDKALIALSAEQKELFTKVLALYRWLHQSSLSQEGFEDRYVIKDQSGVKILRDGALVDVGRIEALEQLNVEERGTQVQKQPEAKKQPRMMVSEQPTAPPAPVVNSTPFIHAAPQALKSDKPALIFDLEDEKEADKFRIKNQESGIKAPEIFEKQLRSFLDEVIKRNNLAFKDEVRERRFVQLMVSRLKDVRGAEELVEGLRKPVEAGGLGLPEEKVNQVQALVEAAKKEFEEKLKAGSLKLAAGGAAEPKPEAQGAKPEVMAQSPQPVPTAPTFDVEAAQAWREQMLRDLAVQGQAATAQAPAVPRPQLMDVKAPPKVVGPLEELRSLTLTDFRRLGATPPEALQKIRAKIDLLSETSLARRLEAVRAWKSSAVYQQYLQVGRESIEQGKPVAVITGNYQTLNEPALTEEEFSAIADFNAKLRF